MLTARKGFNDFLINGAGRYPLLFGAPVIPNKSAIMTIPLINIANVALA